MKQNINQHIIFKLATLILAIALLMPSFVKLSHVFNHHQHEICKGEYKTHLHKYDIDCTFYKFKISSLYSLPSNAISFITIDNNYKVICFEYDLLSEYQNLHSSLRKSK